MARRYSPCPICGGRVTAELIAVDYRWGSELLATIEGTPAGVCEVCGQRYFKAAVVSALERTANSRRKTRRVRRVPVRRLRLGAG